jgi:hypothetical protein
MIYLRRLLRYRLMSWKAPWVWRPTFADFPSVFSPHVSAHNGAASRAMHWGPVIIMWRVRR